MGDFLYGGTDVQVVDGTTLADISADLTDSGSPTHSGQLIFSTTSGQRVTFLVDEDLSINVTNTLGQDLTDDYPLVSSAGIPNYNVYQSIQQGGGERILIITIS